MPVVAEALDEPTTRVVDADGVLKENGVLDDWEELSSAVNPKKFDVEAAAADVGTGVVAKAPKAAQQSGPVLQVLPSLQQTSPSEGL